MFLVDRYTKSPAVNGVARRCLFASRVCLTRAAIRLSWADMTAALTRCAKVRTPGNSSAVGESHIIARGIRPVFKKNGAYPVASERARLIANSIAGNFATQSFWVGLTHCLNI